MAKDKEKTEQPASTEPNVSAPNVVWNGRGEMPTEIHGATVEGRAVTITIPPEARSKDGKGVPFFSPYAGILVEGVDGFERYTPGRAEEG